MSTSLRNKAGLFLALLAIGSARCFAAALADLDPFTNVSVNYVAGIATNTVFIDHDDNASGAGGAPTAGTVVSLLLVDQPGGTERSSSHIPASFTTDGAATTFGLSTDQFTFYRAGSFLLRARSTSPSVTGTSSPAFTVIAGAKAKLIASVSGETLTGGINPTIDPDGKTGTPTTVVVGSTFAVTVQLTDAQFNAVSDVDVVSLTGGSFSTISPASQALVGGVATFIVAITVPKVTETYTASAGGLTSGTVSVTSAGPESEKVAVFPSPFNPHVSSAFTGNEVKFQFVVDTAKSVTLKVTDQFGQAIWEKTVAGLPNTLNIASWDGKNERGTIVAAGAYYVLLEVDGKLKSKKKFGVIK